MTLKIWIASFIPKQITGYTKVVPNGSGKTMIPGPLPTSDCFLTDQRSFSNEPNASARLRSTVEIDMSNLSLKSQKHHCDNTVEIDCEDGDIECNKSPDSSGLKVRSYSVQNNRCTFSFEGGAGNPCALGAPHIDWLVRVQVEKSDRSVTISLANGSMVEPFPAFEMYADLGGTTKLLFKRSPNPGATPWNLIGPPNQSVSGTVTF